MRENRKNQRELAQILFAGIKARTELREPRDPLDGRKRETKKAGPKERSVRLLQRMGALKSALRGTRREEQPREREFPLELEFYMREKTVTRGVKTRHPSPSPG